RQQQRLDSDYRRGLRRLRLFLTGGTDSPNGRTGTPVGLSHIFQGSTHCCIGALTTMFGSTPSGHSSLFFEHGSAQRSQI
ncbi:MAG: hypothetical protein PHE95_04335, partial [Candidatus Methanomethylophilus sp.]|nr:hypothetical protein [Methanomethylophilus sp.]